MVEQHRVVRERENCRKSLRSIIKKHGELNFKFWEFRISHGKLLIRSPKYLSQTVNVDIMFTGVLYVDLPSYLGNIDIDSPTEAETSLITDRLGKISSDDGIFIVKAQVKRFAI
jgi:hypothetical protein